MNLTSTQQCALRFCSTKQLIKHFSWIFSNLFSLPNCNRIVTWKRWWRYILRSTVWSIQFCKMLSLNFADLFRSFSWRIVNGRRPKSDFFRTLYRLLKWMSEIFYFLVSRTIQIDRIVFDVQLHGVNNSSNWIRMNIQSTEAADGACRQHSSLTSVKYVSKRRHY